MNYKLARARALKDFERAYLRAVLLKTSGNLTHAAKVAGIDRKHLWRVMRRSGPSERWLNMVRGWL